MISYPRRMGNKGPPTNRPIYNAWKSAKQIDMPFYPRGMGSNGPPPNRSIYDDYGYDRESSYEYRYDEDRYDEDRYEPISGHQMNSRWQPPRRDMPPRQDDSVRPMDVNCGELRLSDSGLLVRMAGRMQFQRLNRFISLRDSHGTTQLVAPEERLDIIKRIRNIPLDSYIEIIGTVSRRPGHTKNASLATGDIEVVLNEVVDVAAPKRKHPESSGEETPGRTGKKARSSILITSGEITRCGTDAVKKKFQQRTHNCGELKESNCNMEVSLCGWIENKRSDRFLTLRDGYGSAQLVFNPGDSTLSATVQKAKPETLVVAKGKVSMRPSHQRNSRMATGDIEVKVTYFEIIDPNEPSVIEKEQEPTEMEVEKSDSSSGPPAGDVNSYCTRSHTCGQLRGSDVGEEVVLCGWLDSQRTNMFATIRDGHGRTQLLIPSVLEATLGKQMMQTTLESVIMVKGTVCARPPDQVTTKLDTGEVEVVVKEYTVLNPAKKDIPFIVRDFNRPKENLRMKYRYLDLRFDDMQYRLRLRSKLLMQMREFLINGRGFVEVETPTLFKRTPGGAQEFIVPTRTEDSYYSLVQSPQQLKQLLMVGAIDRYFQVARCYRDEGARPDRQPEFTQMDIEVSFTDRESIMSLIEDLLKASWPAEGIGALQTPFPVLSYHEAMHSYGSDKPDISYDNKLIDISSLINDEKKEFLPDDIKDVKDFTAKALIIESCTVSSMRNAITKCEELQKNKNQKSAKLITKKCAAINWKQNLEAALPFVDAEQFKELLNLPLPCTIVVGIGKESEILPLLGKIRQDMIGNKSETLHFAWIVDFPLFLEDDNGQLESAHHPFTQAHPDDISLLKKDPQKVRGLHFDLVLNGYEVGGGSVRIHDPAVQTEVLKNILKLPIDSLEHLLEALASGAPPHGGIALGMDRLLSIMLMTESIRDVIAFPKGVDGKDPLCGAPCSISDEEKRLYHLLPRLQTKTEESATLI